MIFPGEQKQLGEQNFVNANFQMRNAGTKKQKGTVLGSTRTIQAIKFSKRKIAFDTVELTY